MTSPAAQLLFSASFLIVNSAVLLAILSANRGWFRAAGDKSLQIDGAAEDQDAPQPGPDDTRELAPGDVLGWEFEYIRTTASEAMQDRHTMVNFYLLVASVVASGVLAILAAESGTRIPFWAGTVLLWLLCGVGWLYLLKIIRLRQAWHESALAMNRIKAFYLDHSKGIDRKTLESAFRWRVDSLPPPGKPWTVFFYSAMLIAYLDSAAFLGGAILLNPDAARQLACLALLAALGLLFFALHVALYFAFLKQ